MKMEQPQQQQQQQTQQSQSQQQSQQTQLHTNNHNDNRKVRKSPDFQAQGGIVPSSITRERSFVRTSNHQNINKRRSLAFNVQSGNQQNQVRSKPAMDIYRPPNARNDGTNVLNKLNINAQEFTMVSNPQSSTDEEFDNRSSLIFPTSPSTAALLTQSKSTASLHQHMQFVAATNAMINRRHAGQSMSNMPSANAINSKAHHIAHRPILVTHPHTIGFNHFSNLSQQLPLVNSSSSGNIMQQTTNTNRVKFANEPIKFQNKVQKNHIIQLNDNTNHSIIHQQQQQQQQQHLRQQINVPNAYLMSNNANNNNDMYSGFNITPLQRSKSLSSADALTHGFAGLGLALGNDVTDIGQFTPEIQMLIDTALDDPNKLNSRYLMELTSHFIKRAVEGRRYALPISRLCLNIIAKEQKETFLEALLNTCRQWYQEREKLLFTVQGMKSPSRIRFTAFMAFLTEMFCQLKRRQLQLRTQCEGAPPPLVLLTLLSKCCEDCVKPPIKSLSEIECLFFVLTCIGQDMEVQLPQQLEILLSLVRDAFLNSNDSAPSIRRTLLQLIELQASHWQLPGNTVLYYYPSNK